MSIVSGSQGAPLGLTGCWSGDGNAVDVVFGNNGNVLGSVSYVPGKFGQAFSFNTWGDDILIAQSPTLDVMQGDGITLAAWFFPKGEVFGMNAGAGPILEYDNGAQIWQTTQQQDLYHTFFTDMAASDQRQDWHILEAPGTVTPNAWNHGVATYSRTSGNITSYLNGAQVAQVHVGVINPRTAAPFHIGSREPGSFGPVRYTFNGLIDEAQVYNRELTPAEVAQIAGANTTMCTTPSQIAIIAQPAGAESGVPFTTQPIVQLLDASGVPVTFARTPVTATIASGGGTLSGTATVNAVNGIATFTNLQIAGGSAGTTLAFGAPGVTAVQSGSIPVVQVVRQMAVTSSPAGASSGVVLSPAVTVELRDAAGIKVPGATSAVTVSVAAGRGSPSGTTTVNAVGGVATFSSLVISGAGSSTLGFSSAGLLTVTSASIAVTQTSSQLAATSVPATASSGVVLTSAPTVELRDAANVLVSGATNAVTVSIGSGNAMLSGSFTVNAVAGIATFPNLVIKGVGPVTLHFTATGLSAATSNTITVGQVVSQIVVTSLPGNVTSGVPLSPPPTVELRDAAGLKVATASSAVTASVGTGSGVLSGTVTVNAVAGVATFSNLIITGTGPNTLSFALTGNGGINVVGISLNVIANMAPPAQLGITSQPAAGETGIPFAVQPVVAIRDAAGALVSFATNAVTVSLVSTTAASAGSLSGTTTVSAVNGIATFSGLKISSPGVYALKFASSGLASATSATFTVAQGTRQLVITMQPGGAVSYQYLTSQPVIELRDATGAKVINATNAVTVAVAAGNGTVSGTLTVNAVQGVATYTDLIVSGSGAQTLSFSAAPSSGPVSVTSTSFTVAPAPTYSWSGFFDDVDAPPSLNKAKAGKEVDLEFVLGGDKGLAIFAAGSPASRPISCTTLTNLGPFVTITMTGNNGDDHGEDNSNGSRLAYDRDGKQYTLQWQTSKSFDDTCRALALTLADGSTHTAYFSFSK